MELHRARRGCQSAFRRVRNEYPEVAWHRPALLRNRIVHGYWSIDLGILIETARDDLPGFVEQMRQIRAAIRE